MVTIERMYFPANETTNALNAAKSKTITQKTMAGFYADCIRADAWARQQIADGADVGKVDWFAVNKAIAERWPKGLQRVKELAWKECTRAFPRVGA